VDLSSAGDKDDRAKYDLLDADDLQAWTAVLVLHRQVLGHLEEALRRTHGLAVKEFDLLLTLYNVPERRLGMSSLASRVVLSAPGVAHMVTRLQAAGLLRREADPDDGRKGYAVLTGAGEDVLRAARMTHNEVLRQEFLALTTRSERQVLRQVGRRLSPP